MHLVLGNNFPLFAALNGLVKVGHALLDVAAEHVLLVDLDFTPLDNLVGYAGQEATHSLGGVVVGGQLEDHTHAVEDLGEELWDVFWLRVLDLAARVLQDHQELETVISDLEFFGDPGCQFLEALMVGRLGLLEHLDDALERLVFESVLQHAEVTVTGSPVLDFVER